MNDKQGKGSENQRLRICCKTGQMEDKCFDLFLIVKYCKFGKVILY